MSAATQIQRTLKEIVIGNCWEYLRDNFHKLNEANKIKVAMVLCAKSIPQEITGMNTQQIVVMGEIKKNGEPLRFNIGSPAENT